LRLSSTTFQWSREGGEIGGSQYPDAGTLTFSPICHSDAREYRCTATFASPYLNGTYTATGRVKVAVVRKSHACMNYVSSITIMHFKWRDRDTPANILRI
jgi:hypothetical protein